MQNCWAHVKNMILALHRYLSRYHNGFDYALITCIKSSMLFRQAMHNYSRTPMQGASRYSISTFIKNATVLPRPKSSSGDKRARRMNSVSVLAVDIDWIKIDRRRTRTTKAVPGPMHRVSGYASPVVYPQFYESLIARKLRQPDRSD